MRLASSILPMQHVAWHPHRECYYDEAYFLCSMLAKHGILIESAIKMRLA